MTRRLLVLLALQFILLPMFAEAQGVKVSGSIDELEMAAGVDPYDAAAHYNLAIGYWSEERYDEVESELRREIIRGEVPEEWKERVAEMDRLYRRAFLVDPLVDLRIMAAQ